MIEIGKFNRLKIIKQESKGIILDGGDSGEIFLAATNVPNGITVGNDINVFVYHDAKGVLQAMTQLPIAQVDDVAWLKCISVSQVGAFLD